jgi:hypothetical protein
MKKKLNSDIHIAAIIILLIVGFFSSIIMQDSLTSDFVAKEFWGGLLMTLLVVVTCYFLFTSRKIEFDTENLYISKKNSSSKVIPLKNIVRLKLTMRKVEIGFVRRSYYKLEYLDEGVKMAIVFPPKQSENVFEEFEQNLKSKNPDAIIEHWAHSFEGI